MHPTKLNIANDVIELVTISCKQMQPIKDNSDAEPLQSILGIKSEEAQEVINKVITGLPDVIFYSARPPMQEEMERYIAQEFIFFQVQENYEHPNFPNHLFNFISQLTNDIDAKFF